MNFLCVYLNMLFIFKASYLLDDALWGLETTENYLMGQQALYEDKMLKLKEKMCNEERILLSTNVNIFQPIDKETADLYGLIQGPDILPSAIEKALGIIIKKSDLFINIYFRF